MSEIEIKNKRFYLIMFSSNFNNNEKLNLDLKFILCNVQCNHSKESKINFLFSKYWFPCSFNVLYCFCMNNNTFFSQRYSPAFKVYGDAGKRRSNSFQALLGSKLERIFRYRGRKDPSYLESPCHFSESKFSTGYTLLYKNMFKVLFIFIVLIW